MSSVLLQASNGWNGSALQIGSNPSSRAVPRHQRRLDTANLQELWVMELWAGLGETRSAIGEKLKGTPLPLFHQFPQENHIPPPTPNPAPRDINRNLHSLAKTTPGKNYTLVSARWKSFGSKLQIPCALATQLMSHRKVQHHSVAICFHKFFGVTAQGCHAALLKMGVCPFILAIWERCCVLAIWERCRKHMCTRSVAHYTEGVSQLHCRVPCYTGPLCPRKG